MPLDWPMRVVDEQVTAASVNSIFELARDVERWPDHLAHYRFVRFREGDSESGGTVEMSANRPFEPARGSVQLKWPTWWLSLMQVDRAKPSIRFRHIGGITKGMEVEWTFTPHSSGCLVRIEHVWKGPGVGPLGVAVAKYLIGPLFVHGIASRTLAGLIRDAENGSNASETRRRTS
jgi:ribosome-associated toxin RatA of RatAB toxin-antitoxin module